MELSGQPLPSWKVTPLTKENPPNVEAYFGGYLLILFFSVECPGCVGRALPLSRELQLAYPMVNMLGIHTSFKSLKYSIAQIKGVLRLQAVSYPVYLDQENKTYSLYGAEGTPHWLWVNPVGIVEKSIFGSMGNAQQRLWNTLAENFTT
ncbi:MAG: hypothetical protein AAF824_07280 [Bacteroidota bacterium]